jgi:carbonic anhydrase/acetyltransferase-like protein (isoleucine patch superfamily)
MSGIFIHPLAYVAGRVKLAAGVSIWPFAVLRGDTEEIAVGEDSNIQDGTIVHADRGKPALIGKRVGIGHRCVVHGCVIEDECLIGMGAILLNGVRVGSGSIVGAGAVCPEGMEIPPGSLVLGVPGRIIRGVRPDEQERIRATVEAYLELKERHLRGEFQRATQGTR